ncbi:MAG: APC family permease [Gemmatimonadales bacterium]
MSGGAAATGAGDGLLRNIGRWTLVGLVLNGILGSAVYGLPSVLAGKVGGAAWWSWLGAAVVIAIIMACFAEVASRFAGAGGPYLYARVAFGPFVGIQMGWMAYLVRLTAAAANANLVVTYLGEFWPGVSKPAAGGLVLLGLLGGLAAINYRGVKHGARMSNLFIVSKLLPLLLFAFVGIALVLARGPITPAPPTAPITGSVWVETLLILIFAYGGFEAAMVPLSEAKNPQRDAPFALFMALLVCTVIYTMVQLVVSLSLPDAASHARPLAAAARVLAGSPGAVLITIGALLSLFGYLSGATVMAPRLTFAMAEQGDFPAVVGRVHPVYRTPYVSVLLFSALALVLALSGSFVQNLTLSAVSRLATYGLVCLAVPVMRRRSDLAEPAFRLPFAGPIAVLGVFFSLLLATRMTSREGIILAIVATLAGVNWLVARRRRQQAA